MYQVEIANDENINKEENSIISNKDYTNKQKRHQND